MTDAAALLQRMFSEVINQGRLDLIDELVTEDFIDHGRMGDLHGRQAFKEMVAAWRAAAPDVHCELEHVFTVDDLVGWLVRTTGTHTGDGLGFPATGKPFATVSANIARFADDRVAEHWSEQGMFSTLAQIGVLAMPAAV